MCILKSRGVLSNAMSSTGGKLDVLDCAANMDVLETGVDPDDSGEADGCDKGPEMDAVLRAFKEADERLVKRRCNEGFLILRVRREGGDDGDPSGLAAVDM